MSNVISPRAVIGYAGSVPVTPSDVFNRFQSELNRTVQDLTNGGSVPTGTVIHGVWSAAPSGFLPCDGSTYQKRDYPELAALLGADYAVGGAQFRTPNMADRLVIGAGDIAALFEAAGASSVRLTPENLAEHDHTVEIEEHSHSIPALTVEERTPHTHDVDDPEHSHGVTDPQHSHGVTDPTHSHTSANAAGAADVAAGTDATSAVSGATSSNATGVTVDDASTGVTVDDASTGITVGTSSDLDMVTRGDTTDPVDGQTITSGTAGEGVAFSIIPPVLGLAFAIKT